MQAPTNLENWLTREGLERVESPAPLSVRSAPWLQQSQLLDFFTLEELDTLAQAVWFVRAQPGRVLVREGERGDWMLLVLDGTVDVTKRPVTRKGVAPAADAPPERLAVLCPGAAVGEMSMLDGEPRFATCTAIEPVEAAILTRAAIAGLIRDHPTVGAKLLVKLTQLLAQRLRNTTHQMMRLIENNSKE
jgi:CRP/FNR family cyclic AMP-dependent transcriptional regulator